MTLLVVLLLLTVSLAALVAMEAHETSVSHRVTAERALHDYASIAAWELASEVKDRIGRVVGDALAPATAVRAASPYEPLLPVEAIAGNVRQTLACGGGIASPTPVFRLDLRDGSLSSAGPALGPALGVWLRDSVAAHARVRFKPGTRFALLTAPGAPEAVVVYAVRWAQHGAPVAAYGAVTCLDSLVVPIVRAIVRDHALLPSEVTGGAPNDSLLVVSIADPLRRPLIGDTAMARSPYSARVVIDDLGGVSAIAMLKPESAERLLVGRPLRSRLPLLLGLLALTSALAVIALLQLRREHELTRLRADFTSSVSHELRTPLAQILLFSETLSLDRARTDGERRMAADTIVHEARRLMHMVDNLLLFSRSRRNGQELVVTPTDLSSLLESVVAGFAPLARESNVHLSTAIDPGVVAGADPGAVRQIVLNLLDNAVKYGPNGQTVTVSLSMHGDRARIAVDDQGPGVRTDDRERIWSPYVRLRRDRNAASGGSGLGLAVVRELAERMFGSTRVEDSFGGGARFIVELPGVGVRGLGFGGRETTVHAEQARV
jgi:signal transduction histidine kinase